MKEINLDIQTSIIRKKISHFSEIDSTNHYLMTEDLPNGTVVMADYQTAGRGRLQRKWEASKDDALLFSVLVTDQLAQIHPAAFSFLTAIAVYEGLKDVYYDLPLALKWPNDVISNRKKISGILVESKSSGNQFKKVVLGIGININQDTDFFRRDGLGHGTSLKLATGQEGNRLFILESILECLNNALVFAQNNTIQTVIEKWKSFCPYIGKHIKLLEKGEEHLGIFEDLNHEGGIILNHDGNRKTYYAADVSIDKDYL